MVRPAGFGSNPQTAASNAFQRSEGNAGGIDGQAEVLREFDALANALELRGVEVLVAADTADPAKPIDQAWMTRLSDAPPAGKK